MLDILKISNNVERVKRWDRVAASKLSTDQRQRAVVGKQSPSANSHGLEDQQVAAPGDASEAGETLGINVAAEGDALVAGRARQAIARAFARVIARAIAVEVAFTGS